MDKYQNQINRAQLLMSQERWDLAEEAVRSAIGEDPDRGLAYSLLALIRIEEKNYSEAQQLSERGLGLSPDEPYSHYVHSFVLLQRNKHKEAKESIELAISMDPYDAGFHAHKAAIEIQQYAWSDALASAEAGLQFDPNHVQCTNFRAIALTKMGQRDQAGATIDSALASNPEDALSHANMGWTKLHGGHADEAAEHFKEALRLEPDNAWAREGIIESLKAKNFFYRQFLRYILWVTRFDEKTQMMMFIGIIVVLQVMIRMPEGSVLKLIGICLAFAYMAFVVSVWLASPLFDLMLRFNRYGRMVLTPERVADTNYLVLALATVGVFCAGPLLTGFRLNDLIGYTLLMIPVAVTLSTPRVAKRKHAALATIAIFSVAAFYTCRWYLYPGIEGLNGPGKFIEFVASDGADDDPRVNKVLALIDGQNSLYDMFVWPAVLMSWLGGFFRQETR